MQFRTATNRRHVIKAGTLAAFSLGLEAFASVSARTPDASPELADGSYISNDGHLNLTWDTDLWETWEQDDNRIVIGSGGDGSAPFAYRFRSTVDERFWENGESALANMLEDGGTLNREDVILIDSRADQNTVGHVRRMQSPGGEAFAIFEFNRVAEDSDFWVSSEAWIHVDAFDREEAIAQYSSLELNGAPVPTLWTLEEIIEEIAEHTD